MVKIIGVETTPVDVRIGIAGLVGCKLELYPFGTDTIANGAGGDDLVESVNRPGVYTAQVAEALTGMHEAYVVKNGVNLYDGVINLFDTTDTQTVAEGVTVIDMSDTGITLSKSMEMLVAFMSGSVTASSADGITTYTYTKRDGPTT